MAKKKQNKSKPQALEPEKLEFSTDPIVRKAQIEKWADDFVKEHEQEINELLGLTPEGKIKNEEPQKEEDNNQEDNEPQA